MTKHFGSSLVAVRLLAYLHWQSTSWSVAACDANAESLRLSWRFSDGSAVR
jgi:hypothetical protein